MLKLIDVLECAIGESRDMSVLDFFSHVSSMSGMHGKRMTVWDIRL